MDNLFPTRKDLTVQAPQFLPQPAAPTLDPTPLLQSPGVIFQVEPHFAFPTSLLITQSPSAQPETNSWGC